MAGRIHPTLNRGLGSLVIECDILPCRFEIISRGCHPIPRRFSIGAVMREISFGRHVAGFHLRRFLQEVACLQLRKVIILPLGVRERNDLGRVQPLGFDRREVWDEKRGDERDEREIFFHDSALSFPRNRESRLI